VGLRAFGHWRKIYLACAEKQTAPVQPIAHCYTNGTTTIIRIKKTLAILFIIILKLVFI
jgi:hypothetical protein